jgi:hypothetical protein
VIEYPPHPRTRGRTWSIPLDIGPRAILLGSVVIASLALFVTPVADTDFWLHAATGRWIVEHGRLPAHDLFTYTVAGHVWVDHEYLSEVALWLLQARFGMAGPSIAFGLVAWAGLLLVLAACRPGRQPYVITGLAVALAAVAGAPIWGARPQMVTFALVALELLWLRGTVEDGGRAILWLPVAMLLWSNLHGGWAIGFLFLGLAAATEAARWAAGRGPEHLVRLRWLALAGALSALAVGVNPNGPAIYLYPFQTLASSAQQNLIAEWASPDFHLASLRAFEALALLLVAGLAVGRPSLFDVLVAIAGLALALESVRHVAIFVAAATPVLVATWSAAWRRHGEPWLARRRRPAAAPRWGPAVALAALLAVAAVVGGRIAAELARQPEVTARVAPVGAADWLAAHPGVGTRMFNEYTWGGYLADRFAPQPDRRLYILSEGVLMGDGQLLRYHQVAKLAPGWQRVLDQDGVDYVVFDRGSALDDVLATEPGWRLAYRDATAVVYVRTG